MKSVMDLLTFCKKVFAVQCKAVYDDKMLVDSSFKTNFVIDESSNPLTKEVNLHFGHLMVN